MIIQEIEEKHWVSILEIQDLSYQEVGAEGIDVLKSKQKVSPDTCLVSLSNDGRVLCYILAHPWSGFTPPKLFQPLPENINCDYLYLHDMAVRAQSKGQGVGRMLASQLIDMAQIKEFKKVMLVAVQGAENFWSKMGFKVMPSVSVCESYGDNAVLMEKELTDSQSF